MNKTIKILIAIVVILTGCYADTQKNDEKIKDVLIIPDSNARKIYIKHTDSGKVIGVGDTRLKDSTDLKEVKKENYRYLNEHDKQYIDLIIPDYAEIILISENKNETIAYAGELRKYFLSKKADIRKQPVSEEPGQARDKRFYIKSVGDNLYVIHVYDEYLPVQKPAN